jgi:hypothetical protein
MSVKHPSMPFCKSYGGTGEGRIQSAFPLPSGFWRGKTDEFGVKVYWFQDGNIWDSGKLLPGWPIRRISNTLLVHAFISFS